MSPAISLFSGCGGCSLGLSQAGFDITLAAELDDDACRTYGENLGHDALWHTDLRGVAPREILRRIGARVGEVALMIGGPPCQGFSSAGAKDWSDPRNSLLKKFVELVVGVRPVWFVMENVEGLLTSNEGFYVSEAVTQFLKAGYWVRAKKVYMERHGLPQRRKRVIVVGNLEGCKFEFPEETHGRFEPGNLFGPIPRLSILDAIGDMTGAVKCGSVEFGVPPANPYQRQLRRNDGGTVTLHHIKPANSLTARRILHLEQGKTMKDLPEELQHASFSRRAYRRVMDGTPTEKRGGAPSGLKRLVGSEPSLTITSAAPAEFVHPIEDRLLTLRECARIQSFPDSFAFAGSWTSTATQIGNAIPPAFMKLLAERIASMATWTAKEPSTGKWFGIEATKAGAMSPALERTLAELRESTRAYL